MPIFKVDGILLQALLQNPTDREFLLSLESQIITHIFQNQSIAKANQGTLEFPPLNSYHRMLVHRTARYYSLKHWVVGGGEEGGRPRVLLWVEEPTKMPLLKLSELIEPEIKTKMPSTLTAKSTEAVTTPSSTSTPSSTNTPISTTNSSTGPERKLKIMKRPKDAPPPREAREEIREPAKSLKEKEAEYEEVRKRLFADVPSDPEEYREAPNHTPEQTSNVSASSSYFDYQYHVPFYPSYYHSQQQPQQPKTETNYMPQTETRNIGQPPVEQLQRTKYVEELAKIPLPRHILSIAIGYNGTTQKRLLDAKIIVREDDDNVIAIFPDSEMAQTALKNGLGTPLYFLTALVVNVTFAPWVPNWFPIQMVNSFQKEGI